MKHVIIIDDERLSNFRIDDNGKTIIVKDKAGFERGFNLIPLGKPLVIKEDGEMCYLTQEHIDCLIDFERKKSYERMVESFSFDEDYSKIVKKRFE
jgi:hypothetical protein